EPGEEVREADEERDDRAPAAAARDDVGDEVPGEHRDRQDEQWELVRDERAGGRDQHKHDQEPRNPVPAAEDVLVLAAAAPAPPREERADERPERAHGQVREETGDEPRAAATEDEREEPEDREHERRPADERGV